MGVTAPKKECAVVVCDRMTEGWQEFCKPHYAYWKRTGEQPKHRLRMVGATPIDRFMSKVAKTDTCWLWTARLNASRYGVFADPDGNNVLAHRWLYLETVGSVPKGLELDHLCRVRHCVNPAHLEPVTTRENGRRSPLHNGAKTHCKRNHEFTPENTFHNGSGRVCRTCARLRAKRYTRRKAAL